MFSQKFRELLLMTPGLSEELDAFYKRLGAFLSVSFNDDGTLLPNTKGKWMPTLGGSGGTSGQTYVVRRGTYLKRGEQVQASFRLELSAKGTITSVLELQDLPFRSASVDMPGVVVIGYHDSLNTNVVHFSGQVNVMSTAATLYMKTAAAAAVSAMATANVTDTTEIWGTAIYEAEE